MEREFKILTQLHPLFRAAPKPLLFCNQLDVVGSPFFLMERKNGFVLDTSFPEGINVTPQLCKQISIIMVEKLVDLHSINYRNTELAQLSKPDGFMARQVHGWINRYDRAKTDEIEVVDS